MKSKVQNNQLTPIFLKEDPFGKWLKVHNDGGHFVGIKCFRYGKKIERCYCVSDYDRFFDEIYFSAVKQGLRYNALREYLKKSMSEMFPNLKDIDKFVDSHIKRKLHNFYNRIKRFKRKANLNNWNYFITITYDSKKMDADAFRRKLRKCLSNFHSRRNWSYMGVFELSPEENRLHFHALVNIPEGQMVGEIAEERSYSTKKKAMQTANINSFFAERFGRNDFAPLTDEDLKFGHAIEYITKYLNKTNEKIVYSRGIPSEMVVYVENENIATTYSDFVLKFLIFDDAFDSDKRLIKYKPLIFEQTTFFDCC